MSDITRQILENTAQFVEDVRVTVYQLRRKRKWRMDNDTAEDIAAEVIADCWQLALEDKGCNPRQKILWAAWKRRHGRRRPMLYHDFEQFGSKRANEEVADLVIDLGPDVMKAYMDMVSGGAGPALSKPCKRCGGTIWREPVPGRLAGRRFGMRVLCEKCSYNRMGG